MIVQGRLVEQATKSLHIKKDKYNSQSTILAVILTENVVQSLDWHDISQYVHCVFFQQLVVNLVHRDPIIAHFLNEHLSER